MALNSSTLSSLAKANLLSGSSGAIDNAALTALCDAFASAIVTHIQTAGVVATVTACPAGAGTGTGTLS